MATYSKHRSMRPRRQTLSMQCIATHSSAARAVCTQSPGGPSATAPPPPAKIEPQSLYPWSTERLLRAQGAQVAMRAPRAAAAASWNPSPLTLVTEQCCARRASRSSRGRPALPPCQLEPQSPHPRQQSSAARVGPAGRHACGAAPRGRRQGGAGGCAACGRRQPPGRRRCRHGGGQRRPGEQRQGLRV